MLDFRNYSRRHLRHSRYTRYLILILRLEINTIVEIKVLTHFSVALDVRLHISGVVYGKRKVRLSSCKMMTGAARGQKYDNVFKYYTYDIAVVSPECIKRFFTTITM